MSSRASALVLLALIAAPLSAQNPETTDEAQVRTVVESYLHGLKFNDVESLKKAFWPDAASSRPL